MNYIELINRFWKLDTAYSFSPYEVQLYFILLDYANRSGWKEPLYLPNNRLIARMGCSKTAFIRARQRLNDDGVIGYQKGTTRTAGKYYYSNDWSTTNTNRRLIEDQSKTNSGLIEIPIAVPYIRHRQELDKDKSILDTDVSMSSRDDVPYKEIVSLYNSICKSYKPVSKLTDKRKAHIRARWSEYKSLDKFKAVFESMEKSHFLKGDNNRGWQADFDWMMKNESNFLKILEGKYANREVKHGTTWKANKKTREKDDVELYKNPAGTEFTDEELDKLVYKPKRKASTLP